MNQLDDAYYATRAALRGCLQAGEVDAQSLAAVRAGMTQIAPHKAAFGAARYNELMRLLAQVEELPDVPVLNRQQPVLTARYHREPYWRVPWPYQFHWDKGWITVLFLAGAGLVWKPLMLLAAFIAVLRCWVYICYRFPMTATFIFGFLEGLLGGRRRRW